MKSVIFLLTCIAPFLTYAQGDTLDIETAREYILHSSQINIRYYKEGTKEYELLDAHSPGDIVVDGSDIYVVLEFKTIPETHCSYIFIDGKKLTQKEIQKTQSQVLKLYKKGTSFDELIKKYGMDESPEVYEFKFTKDEAIPEFEKSVLDDDSGTAFMINIPKEKKYFIVVKKTGNFTRKIIVGVYYSYPKKDYGF